MGENNMNQLNSDIAVIKNRIENLDKNFTEFKDESKRLISRVDIIEDRSIATSEKVSNLAIFQGIFSVIIGAIATYLGVNRK
jgi:predicted  nucleic acid-binding Zn-ribbon protein